MVFKNEKVVRLNHQTEIKKLCFVATYLVFLLLANCQLFELPKIGRGAEILAIAGTLTQTNTGTGTSTGTDTGTTPPTAETPTFSPSAGYYAAPQNVTLSTTTSGASIYYTTDGSTPTSGSTSYSTAWHIWKIAGQTIKAIATKTGYTNSSILSGVFSYPPLKSGLVTSYQAGDDGTSQLGVTRSFTGPTAHATYTGDFTTTDNATGLVWNSCSQGLSGATCAIGAAQIMPNDGTATDATNHATWGCSALNSANSGNGYAGIKTWRLPTRKELETLIDYGVSVAPVINGTAFPGTMSGTYWSSTTYAPNTTDAWVVSFNVGVVANNGKPNPYYVRCVSGP